MPTSFRAASRYFLNCAFAPGAIFSMVFTSTTTLLDQQVEAVRSNLDTSKDHCNGVLAFDMNAAQLQCNSQRTDVDSSIETTSRFRVHFKGTANDVTRDILIDQAR